MVKNLSTVTIPVHATKHPNVLRRSYGTLVEGEGSTTILLAEIWEYHNGYKIKVEILNTQINRSTAQSQMV